MQSRMYRLRGMAVENGPKNSPNLELEFDGARAFVIWDTIPVGRFELKARLEIDTTLLEQSKNRSYDFFYHGKLVLPRPQDN